MPKPVPSLRLELLLSDVICWACRYRGGFHRQQAAALAHPSSDFSLQTGPEWAAGHATRRLTATFERDMVNGPSAMPACRDLPDLAAAPS